MTPTSCESSGGETGCWSRRTRSCVEPPPDPEIFLTAAKELGIKPQHALVLEDASSGVRAPKAGGMTAIGIARANDAGLLSAKDLVVTSLDEVDTAALSEGRLRARAL